MHRISTLPGNEPQEENTFIEQPSAPVIFLTSATSDITCLSTVLKLPDNNNWKNKIRALPIAYLSSNASIDHYISNTCNTAEIILVRFLGSRSYWSYGFEQLGLWQLEKPNRHLIVVPAKKDIERLKNEVPKQEVGIWWKKANFNCGIKTDNCSFKFSAINLIVQTHMTNMILILKT